MAGLATDGDMRRECIRFNYPDEFLTSVDGNYEANLSGSWLSSLTFNTNRKTYGPFGSTPNRNRRSYFSIHVPGSKIVGFHGRSHRWWSTNFDIGAYLKPIDQQSEYATSTALSLHINLDILLKQSSIKMIDLKTRNITQFQIFELAEMRETATELSIWATSINIRTIISKKQT
ncbi:jacalin-related lectin 3-like isoform X2 [Rosa rugosa]|uniref:jacalin-related lectin 3-like isoform X2 n=1 Tax=Rosa rugosa TaxID=74645 RepID=UPI002B403D20|nr:jacalin-related lectin 3-like isoform X2 [Rosa rugosa]